jgi:hypothetical protein
VTLDILAVITLLVAALSLGPSFAHLLEAPPRLRWSPRLWIDATVRGRQFELFRNVGGVIDVAVIILGAVLAWQRRGAAGFSWAAGGALLYAAALAAWAIAVAPANRRLAGWGLSDAPSDFEAVRRRWERGHIVVATLKMLAFAGLAAGVAAEG